MVSKAGEKGTGRLGTLDRGRLGKLKERLEEGG